MRRGKSGKRGKSSDVVEKAGTERSNGKRQGTQTLPTKKEPEIDASNFGKKRRERMKGGASNDATKTKNVGKILKQKKKLKRSKNKRLS